jgi:pimeloyl-ACP methyl ester carboxylesterase
MSKPTLLLLHGALGASVQFAPLLPLLGEKYDVHLLDFEGHGSTPPKARPFRMEHFVENVHDYLSESGIEQTNIFGYSMGGYVACVLAEVHPHLVGNLATLGTKFHWDPEVAAREVGFLDPEKIEAKVPHFAQSLAERHPSGWKAVVARTAEMMIALGETGGFSPDTIANVQQRLRIIVGDHDTTVGVPESYAMYQALPNGELEVLPATPHQLEKVPPPRLAASLSEFFS